MINEILDIVKGKIGTELVEKVGIQEAQVQQGLETVSTSMMDKVKTYIDGGKLLELKDVFTSGDDTQKEALIEEVKTKINGDLASQLNISNDKASLFSGIALPSLIGVTKEKLLGSDGKIGFTDIPRLLAFFKSGGKEVSSSGGLGGLFGF